MSSLATSDLKDAANFHVPEDALLPCSELHDAAERGDVELLKMLLSRPEPEPAVEVGLGKGFAAAAECCLKLPKLLGLPQLHVVNNSDQL